MIPLISARKENRMLPVMWSTRLLPWLRLLALLSLVVCVQCKMIDLDCALSQPAHCQTVLEAGDNSFAQVDLHQPAWSEPVAFILDPVQIPPATLCPRAPWLDDGEPLAVNSQLRHRPPDCKRPPPLLTCL